MTGVWPRGAHVRRTSACGLPVVTSDVGGNAEIVWPEHDGLLVPFGNPSALVEALRRALEMRWDHDAISERALVRTGDQTAGQVAAELHSVLEARRHRPPEPLAYPVEKKALEASAPDTPAIPVNNPDHHRGNRGISADTPSPSD